MQLLLPFVFFVGISYLLVLGAQDALRATVDSLLDRLDKRTSPTR